MKTVDVGPIVDKCLEPLTQAFCLAEWEIEVKVSANECPESRGSCTADPAYYVALIIINPERCKDEADVYRTMQHELIHIIHAEMGHKDRLIKEALTGAGHPLVSDVIMGNSDYLSERMVARVEKMLNNGLGISPKEIATGGKAKKAGWIRDN